jgi:hypothetical protein
MTRNSNFERYQLPSISSKGKMLEISTVCTTFVSKEKFSSKTVLRKSTTLVHSIATMEINFIDIIDMEH